MPQASATYDMTAVGHAIVDVLAPCEERFLASEGLTKGAMTLIDQHRAVRLYDQMLERVETEQAPIEQTSGGSAANTVAGAASLGAKCAYIGKVQHDPLGEAFTRDMQAQGVRFATEFLHEDPTHTGRCLINITPDGQRTMATFLGAAALVGPKDVDPEVVAASSITYLEGYLFDTPSGREAFAKASEIARATGRLSAITLSDAFVVERWHGDLMAFIDRHIDLVFANEVELLSLFHTQDLNTALSGLRQRVSKAFITRSEQGSVIVAGAETHLIPVFDVKSVVDTTGAGDQYAAGVLFGLSQGLALETCGRLGALAASEVIGHYGPRPQENLRALATKFGLI